MIIFHYSAEDVVGPDSVQALKGKVACSSLPVVPGRGAQRVASRFPYHASPGAAGMLRQRAHGHSQHTRIQGTNAYA